MASETEPKLIERSKQSPAHCWNVEALYKSWQAWEEEFKRAVGESKGAKWPQLASFKKEWSDSISIATFKNLVENLLTIDRSLSKLYTYAHLRHDEDVGSEVPKQAYSRITSTLYDFRQETAWFEPALLKLPQERLQVLLNAPELAEYRLHLEKIVRMKPHTLSTEAEELLASAGKALETASKAFGAFNNADLRFPNVVDGQGRERELTIGRYQVYLRDPDRKLREEVFKTLQKSYLTYENTLCELLSGQVCSHAFEAHARHFPSCLEAALFPNQIDVQVYHSLIKAVRSHLPAVHKYMALRKKALGVDALHYYDLSIPLVKDVEMGMTYEEAIPLVIDSMAPLGPEYQATLKKGLAEDRWVDRYENMRKRSGAYSSGCFDSMPYILLNYHGTFNDMMTLTHEAGHSMHSLLSRNTQPYQYAQYPIFVAEVASTFHEELLLRALLKKVTSKEQRAFLINQKIDDMRATLVRQTMFAEFELMLHQMVEQEIPLTPEILKREYRKLNVDYFGPDVVLDPELDIEWARVPHFYYNFYVYQYATGISAAHALVEKVLHEGLEAKERYLKFISSGSRGFPLDLLREAGVDMRSPAPVETAMCHFKELVLELETLLK